MVLRTGSAAAECRESHAGTLRCPAVWGLGKNVEEAGDGTGRGDVFVKESRHGGLVAGPAVPGGTFPSVEGNTWAKSDFAHRREGVYVLQNERVARCTFARLV